MREAGKSETGSAPGLPGEPGVEDLAQAADRLFYAMRRSRAATVGQYAAGLSLAQLALLTPLAEGAGDEGLPVGRLAAHAEVSVPTATRMLKQLEGKNVVTRRRSPQDERQVLIRLTQEGAEHLAVMQAQLRARQYAALSQFTPQERHVLAAQLHRLAGVISETTPRPAGPAADEG
ncbi:MarR family winged helix-turn-helix transcriptional regulator [Streptomyces iconiensis]|uniref:MarR family transcriptional regulator n=1 Tax=Streptomyces iconiensis TaxID=1384038 RepID=A0ABT6ZYV4_9ACTN|nr:MarR family transcriptional regulator [Streptomyces iconiensis]MDJ1134254.1 MarR family transcriptional regulator [Streptomyces iconiensis]